MRFLGTAAAVPEGVRAAAQDRVLAWGGLRRRPTMWLGYRQRSPALMLHLTPEALPVMESALVPAVVLGSPADCFCSGFDAG